MHVHSNNMALKIKFQNWCFCTGIVCRTFYVVWETGNIWSASSQHEIQYTE